MSPTALAIFVKTPGHSPVKTRLAAGIGKERAEQFYRLSLACAEELALALKEMGQGQIVPYWAVSELEALNDPLWQRLERLFTGLGGLGERQDQVYRALRQNHERVIFIGADSPQLMPAAILRAIRTLQQRPGFVLGPCQDGGYYLFGGAREVPSEAWTSVTYSEATTARDLSVRLAQLGPLERLERSFDVDTQDGLVALTGQRGRMVRKAQIQLLEWIAREGLGGAVP